MSWSSSPGEPPGGSYYDQPYSPYALPPGGEPPPYGPPPPPGQPPYGPPPYGGQPPYAAYPQPPRTNTFASVSWVCSLCGIFVVPFAASIAGIIFGHIAKKQLRESGEQGDGLATGGLIVGYIFAGLWLLGCIGYIVVIVLAIGSASTVDSGYDDYTFVLPLAASLFGR